MPTTNIWAKDNYESLNDPGWQEAVRDLTKRPEGYNVDTNIIEKIVSIPGFLALSAGDYAFNLVIDTMKEVYKGEFDPEKMTQLTMLWMGGHSEGLGAGPKINLSSMGQMLRGLPKELKQYIPKFIDKPDELAKLEYYKNTTAFGKVAPESLEGYRPGVRLKDNTVLWHPDAMIHMDTLELNLGKDIHNFDFDSVVGSGSIGPNGVYYEDKFLGDVAKKYITLEPERIGVKVPKIVGKLPEKGKFLPSYLLDDTMYVAEPKEIHAMAAERYGILKDTTRKGGFASPEGEFLTREELTQAMPEAQKNKYNSLTTFYKDFGESITNEKLRGVEKIESDLGVRYDGVQEGIGYQWTDNKTGSTTYTKTLDELELRIKLGEMRKIFRIKKGEL